MNVTAIVLAAGRGSRFRAEAGADQDKLLAECVGLDGVTRPVIEQVLRNLPARAVERWLVTSPDRMDVIRLAQAYGCEVLLLDSAGMGDSLAAAVTASGPADGWLVVLGDMPFIQSSSIERVIDGLEGDGISVPVQDGQYGHPVGFGRACGAGLMTLSGDRGAKSLFAKVRVHAVVVEDPGVLWDVDLPQFLSFKQD
ncbi:nucleotidyltransferase family protein [Pseudomonas nabeulensis]|uniref:Nucleotidyltransferase family protein n=1 Tax=Pseudomonas nabeulensis TaxID=2293833 RepID=A0A4Z0B4T1_9PSED|nr:nucleotidyltransferase family protein [Pseudomonas nabeulensis]TFY93537.1 nucleotidyltransferase family protein [Pseudomonas nabeulensis]